MPHARPLATLVLAAALTLGAGAAAQTLLVSAASSLTEAMEAVATAFEAEHDGVRVDLNLAGSSTLAAQILQGAPADVFASANAAQMDVVADAGLLASDPVPFARNALVAIAPADAPLADLGALAEPGTLVVLAAPEVPAGAYARTALAALGDLRGDDFEAAVLANVVSEEPNVRQVAAKVALGEADAAIVYATDAAAVDGLAAIPIPAAANVDARYPVAPIAGSDHPELAAAFAAFLRSEPAQALLAERGFRAP